MSRIYFFIFEAFKKKVEILPKAPLPCYTEKVRIQEGV